jgi:hypothetical protein
MRTFQQYLQTLRWFKKNVDKFEKVKFNMKSIYDFMHDYTV